MHRRGYPDGVTTLLYSFILVLITCSLVAANCQKDEDCAPPRKCIKDTCVYFDGYPGKNGLEDNSVHEHCSDLTTGTNCEKCIPGYWKNPMKDGKCQPCECNGHATECDPDTGKCFCTTMGIIGDHCEKCNEVHHYTEDPVKKELCSYDLATNYLFTFNLSRNQDRQYTQINFRNSPEKSDINTEFKIKCSRMAKINITVKRANSEEEETIFTTQDCNLNTFKKKFLKDDYDFGEKNNVSFTTFYVYVYDFRTPLWIQVGFVQYDNEYIG